MSRNKVDYNAIDPSAFYVKRKPVYYFFKRFFDITISFLVIIIFSWLFILLWVLVKCTSKGPGIYVSDRVGKDGKVFKFYKFRSMKVDAEQELESLMQHNETGGITFKMKGDPRITKFGKILRKTSLDELPQFFNILKGDMSIVGPRPCTTREYQLYSERDKLRLLVPQGLTGYWQIHGRSNTSFEEMMKLDLKYICERRGFFYDIWLIIRTLFKLFTHGAAE